METSRVTVSIDPERIKEFEKKNKDNEAGRMVRELFAEVFEDEEVFCKLGTLFKRRMYPENVYAVFKWNGEVRILNITENKMWDSKKNLKVSQLRDPNQETLTVTEFKALSGRKSLDGFYFVEPEAK